MAFQLWVLKIGGRKFNSDSEFRLLTIDIQTESGPLKVHTAISLNKNFVLSTSDNGSRLPAWARLWDVSLPKASSFNCALWNQSVQSPEYSGFAVKPGTAFEYYATHFRSAPGLLWSTSKNPWLPTTKTRKRYKMQGNQQAYQFVCDLCYRNVHQK